MTERHTFENQNRKSVLKKGPSAAATIGGDEAGANSLYQYTNRTIPGYVNVMGSASTNATVSIWGSDGSYSATSRKGEYYRGELVVDNTTNSLWLTVTNVAVLTNGGGSDIVTNTTGNAFLAQTPEAFLYDLDGNLTVDGRWTNYWNAENRLIQTVCLTNAATGSKLRLMFAYDYQGRRITKQLETWGGSAWSVTLSNKFLYDGWNLIAELNGTNNAVIRNYMWGTDLSGSMQGAGGVGGLLAVQSAELGVQSFVAFDGNGNVAALVKASDGSVSANYEYGPFGELTKASGVMARANAVRFSTKYQDDETDLVYYGYRYYSTSTGRWESRDLVEERGGASLYVFVGSAPVNFIDLLGLADASGSLDMLFAYVFGYAPDTAGLSARLTDDVERSSSVTSFRDTLLARGRSEWQCGKTSTFIPDASYFPEFNPANDMPWWSAHGLNWILTGNWQLHLKGKCDTKCTKCDRTCKCKCYVRCKITGNISKLYTFMYVNGNWVNIFTTPPSLLYPTKTYIVSQDFTIPGLDVGEKTCKEN